MELPAIKLPEVILPLDIPVLMHPPVDHFVIALPIIILFIEFINLFAKKRAIGVVSFLLLLLTVIAAAAAYYTGSIDAKEAFPLLGEAAQGEMKAHKLLGTWLLIASAVVVTFKLLSAMFGGGIMKVIYLFVLILFVAGILKQGQEGGELVYKYGANVEAVQNLDSELFDVKEELEELQEEFKALEKESKTPKSKEAVPAAVTTTETKKAPAEAVPASIETEAKESPEEIPVVTEAVESIKVEAVEEKVEVIEVVTETKEISEASAAETASSSTESVIESTKTEVEESTEAVEVIPEVVETGQIATH